MKIPTKTMIKYHRKLVDMKIPTKERRDLTKKLSGFINFICGNACITKLAIQEVQDKKLKGKKAFKEIKEIIEDYSSYCFKKDDSNLNEELEFYQSMKNNPFASGQGYHF